MLHDVGQQRDRKFQTSLCDVGKRVQDANECAVNNALQRIQYFGQQNILHRVFICRQGNFYYE